MFAMVLAIGLLVDDAIVVVENVERVMHDEGLSPREAAFRSMTEITGALIGITTVLSVVFVPMAFFGGSVGVIYRQFAVTIVSAMVLSVIVALVLTPALCATILRPPKPHDEKRGAFGWFNRVLGRGTDAYQAGARGMLRRPRQGLIAFVLVIVAAGALFIRLPTSFLPEEDQGLLMVSVQLPVGATTDRTERVLDKVTRYFLDHETKAVDGLMTVTGFSFSGAGQNVGMAFVRLKD
jgi:multidrug efflux pump